MAHKLCSGFGIQNTLMSTVVLIDEKSDRLQSASEIRVATRLPSVISPAQLLTSRPNIS